MTTAINPPARKKWPATPEADRALMQNMREMSRQIYLENEKVLAIANPQPKDFAALYECEMRFLELILNAESLASVRAVQISVAGFQILHGFLRGGSGELCSGTAPIALAAWHPAMLDWPTGIIGKFVAALREIEPDLTIPFAVEAITFAN